jgi:hypothetical protein
MKLDKKKMEELRYCAEDLVRSGEKILGMLEGEKVKDSEDDDYEEDKKEKKGKPSKTDIMAAFIKK